jgi:hypothetical protein
MVTSAPAGLLPSIFLTQSYSGKIVVTICILSSPDAASVVPAVSDVTVISEAAVEPHAKRQPAIIMAAIRISIFFFIINLRYSVFMYSKESHTIPENGIV